MKIKHDSCEEHGCMEGIWSMLNFGGAEGGSEPQKRIGHQDGLPGAMAYPSSGPHGERGARAPRIRSVVPQLFPSSSFGVSRRPGCLHHATV